MDSDHALPLPVDPSIPHEPSLRSGSEAVEGGFVKFDEAEEDEEQAADSTTRAHDDDDEEEEECVGRQATEVRISRHLEDAKRQGRLRRWRISGGTLLVGFGALLPGLTCFSIFWGVNIAGNIGAVLCSVGCPVLLLSILPSDTRVIHYVSCFSCMVLFLLAALDVLNLIAHLEARGDYGDCSNLCDVTVPCWRNTLAISTTSVKMPVTLSMVAYLVRCMGSGAGRTLEAMWKISGICWLMQGVDGGIAAVADGLTDSYCVSGVLDSTTAVFCIVAAVVALLPDCRFRAQSWLGSLGQTAGAAAGIASLLGGADVPAVLSTAQRHFRYVSADKVLQEDMSSNIPDPRLYALSRAARLGRVDAFLSHSWSDDPELKWDALQTWRRDFVSANHREPRLWIDKYCIDQRNMSDSLTCLPLFLSGCRELLVLFGPTYSKRLWCLMEIFVFIEMKSERSSRRTSQIADSIVILPLAKDNQEVSRLRRQALAMDVFSARCFHQADSERLRSIMEAGSTSRQSVNNVMKNMVCGPRLSCSAAKLSSASKLSERPSSLAAVGQLCRRSDDDPMRRSIFELGSLDLRRQTGAPLSEDIPC